MLKVYCLKAKAVKKPVRKSLTKNAIQMYWLKQDRLRDIMWQNGVQAESLGPLTLWEFVFLPLDWNNGWRPGLKLSDFLCV